MSEKQISVCGLCIPDKNKSKNKDPQAFQAGSDVRRDCLELIQDLMPRGIDAKLLGRMFGQVLSCAICNRRRGQPQSKYLWDICAR